MIPAAKLRELADLLDDNDVFDLVATAVMDSRDKAPRHAEDRDSADVLTDVIAAIRAAAQSAT